MFKALLIICNIVLLIIVIVLHRGELFGSSRATPLPQSVFNVAFEPEKFANKYVVVRGYLKKDFTGQYLVYPTEELAKLEFDSLGVALNSNSTEALDACTNSYVKTYGRYYTSRSFTGHDLYMDRYSMQDIRFLASYSPEEPSVMTKVCIRPPEASDIEPDSSR